MDGTRVRLAISAPEDVPILRSELVVAATANRDSAMEEAAPAELLDLLGGVLDHKQGRGSAPQTQTPEPPVRKED